MTTHRSLRGANTLVGERSVLSRVERIEKLKKDGKLDPETDSCFGLPKVRTKFKVAKVKKETVEGAEGAEGAEGTEGAEETPAEGGDS